MKAILQKLVSGDSLTRAEAQEAFNRVMSGDAMPEQTAALLAMIQLRQPTVDEMVGAAYVMREKSRKVYVPEGLTAVDTCGTGGDHAGTFNISTAAAIVLAGAGRSHDVVVAKHGNRAVTGKTGSSQVLEALGVGLEADDATLTRCLAEAGIAFCFAPAHHPAMKYAVPVRQALGFRTIFNLVGPLTNPAGARRQVIGVFESALVSTLAKVLQTLGTEHAMIVHGSLPMRDGIYTGLDELSVCGVNKVSEVREGEISSYNLDPAELGLSLGVPSALMADTPEQSAQLIQRILQGEHGPARDIVVLNAAAAIRVANITDDWTQAIAIASEAIDSGQAARSLETLAKLTKAA